MSVQETLLQIINNLLKKEGHDILTELRSELSLSEDLGFDSLALAELTVVIEDEYGVDIFEEDIIDSIGEILLQLTT
jgi:acyl carrier protein